MRLPHIKALGVFALWTLIVICTYGAFGRGPAVTIPLAVAGLFVGARIGRILDTP